MKMHMPAISTDKINTSNFKKSVEKGVYDFKNEKDEFANYIGIFEERNEGSVDIYPTDSNIGGLTKISRDYQGAKAEKIEISKNLPEWYVKRVTEHELGHVLSERLLDYIDVDENVAIEILESIPEYGYPKFLRHKGRFEEAEKIEKTTPYPKSVLLGYFADKYYFSDIDGEKGYRAFIKDIQRHKSMKKPLERLDELVTASE